MQDILDRIAGINGYIDENAQAVRNIINNRKEISREFVAQTKGKTYDRVVICGIGSSNNGGLIVKPFIEELLGVEVTVAVPAAVMNVDLIKDENVLYFGVSQTGRSTTTVEWATKAVAAGKWVCGITDDPESKLATTCSLAVGLSCGYEKEGPMTKGVTATAVTMCMLVTEYAFAKGLICECKYNDINEKFLAVADRMDKNIALAREWMKQNVQIFDVADSVDLIAAAQAEGAAVEVALKIKETSLLPSSGHEIENYLHGPCAVMGHRGNRVVLLDSLGYQHERLLAIGAFLEKYDIPYLCLSQGEGKIEGNRLYIDSVKDSRFDVFEFLPPLQVLAMAVYESFTLQGKKGIMRGFDVTATLNTKLKKQ